jgi:branched-chain amino acid transport system substrate-binding protein
MVFDEVNEKGGILGRKIDYKISDDAASPDRGASLARRYIEADKVLCITGPNTSGSGLAILKIASEEGVPVLPHAWSNALHKGEIGKWCFASGGNNDEDMGARMMWAKKNGFKKMAIMWVNYEWGRDGKDFLYARAKDYGLTIVGDVPVERGTAECTAEAAKVKEMKPDAIFLVLLTKEQAAAARAFAALNWKPRLIGTGPAIEPALKLVDPKLMEGWQVAVHTNQAAPDVVALLKKFKDKYGTRPTSEDYFMEPYSGLTVLVHVLKTMIGKGEPLTRSNLRDGMEKYSAGADLIHPKPRKSPGWGTQPPHILIRAADFMIATIKNGKVVVD